MTIVLRKKKRSTLSTLLSKYGTNAHAWLPGASGVSVSGLPTSNYLLSDGSTGFSSTDSVVGLVLDGMGSVGAELVTNGGFDTDTAWTKEPGWTISGGKANFSNPTATNIYQGVLTSTKTYKATIVISSVTSGNVAIRIGSSFSSYFTAAGTYEFIAVAGSFVAGISCANGPVPTVASIDSFSVREITGTHLTQATTANKPLVRRGMLNELLNSATPATQSVTCIAAPYTLALYGTGNVVLSGTGAGTLTGTGASDLVVLNFTPTAGSVTFTKAGTVSSFGLFKGTWTATQILAEGGIPTTTATAASSPSAGKYWWSFDGSNDSLLSGNLGITNTVTVVIAGVLNTLPELGVLIGGNTNGLKILTGDGQAAVYIEGGSFLVASAAGALVAGVPFVLTFRLQGGTAVLRKNGTQIATNATAIVFSSTDGVRIGTAYGGNYPENCSIYSVNVITATTTDAECLSIERLVAQQAGITI